MKDKNGRIISRRSFLKSSAAAAISFTVVPRHVLGGANYISPSEKLNIAGVGIGGMGKGNVMAMARVQRDDNNNPIPVTGPSKGENIVALCDVDDAYSAGTYRMFPNAKRYQDFRIMLDKQKDIDAVMVATPDHTHATIALKAINMGKHVYVQKPLTYTVKEARMLTEAARKMGVATQMGNQAHSGEGIRLVREWIQAGAIGDVREVHVWTTRAVWPQGRDMKRPTETPPVPDTLNWDLWLGPAPYRPYHPSYLPFNWRAWTDFGTGALGDMACHYMDPAFMALDLKYPESVQACISTFNRDWKTVDYGEVFPRSSIVRYTFPARGKMPKVKFNWYDGGMQPEIPDVLEDRRRMPAEGNFFIGDKGMIMCSGNGTNPRLVPETAMKVFKRPPKTIKRIEGGSGGHEYDWIKACKGGDPASSNFEYSGPLTETVLMGNLAIRFPNKKLKWDGKNMRITNNDQANEFVHRKYRQGWTL